MSNAETIFGEMEEKAKFDSDFLKLEVGKNVVRILSDFVKVESIYKGEYPNSKYQGIFTPGRVLASDEALTTQGWAWVINRKTGEVKIAQFGKNILGQIVTLKNDPEYKFDSFPAPYDITINNTGEGASRYSVIAARTNTELTTEEMALLNKKNTVSDIVAKIVEKQTRPAGESAPGRVAYPENNLGDNDWGPASA